VRQGIIRDAVFLPPVAYQRDVVQSAGCDQIRDEQGSDFIADRRVQALVQSLQPGDEIVVCGFGALCRPQGQPAQVLRDIFETGVVLKIAASPSRVRAYSSETPLSDLLELIAEHERARPGGRKKSVHQGGSKNRLSKYQVEYAKKLYAEGESLRSIGLLFQMSPSHVLDLVAPPRPNEPGVDGCNR
jgi:hypothetical protein